MDIVFQRLGGRRYAIEVRRLGAPRLRMDPAPGFDDYFPHDLQHLVVEEQLGITNGIFGRLANGGTASTFNAVRPTGKTDRRASSRQQRALRRRDDRLGTTGSNDFARSERATYVVWHDWLAQAPEAALQATAASMASTAESILERMAADERSTLLTALPRIRLRVDTVARCWAALAPGESMSIGWVTGAAAVRSLSTSAGSIALRKRELKS